MMSLREQVYSETAMQRLTSNPNIRVLVTDSTFGVVDDDVRRRRLPLHGRFVTRLFNDLFGIQARGGCACAGPYGHTLLNIENDLSLRIRAAILEGYSGLKPGWTRLSFSYYLLKEEFKFILSAIEFIASYGHRFLSLYKFDWITGNWTFKKQAIKYHIMKEELALSTRHDRVVENGLSKVADILEQKPGLNQDKFRSYLESAKKIALSLPDISQQNISIPKGVDLDLVLFYI
ncbi:hypothetical protein QOZ80_5AG0384190 [Eleusine coracana subsp. coracana]|nr:hypothetical protein QOZ80_5AG0384190 [Eleusine coracana subsp. coracana]